MDFDLKFQLFCAVTCIFGGIPQPHVSIGLEGFFIKTVKIRHFLKSPQENFSRLKTENLTARAK